VITTKLSLKVILVGGRRVGFMPILNHFQNIYESLFSETESNSRKVGRWWGVKKEFPCRIFGGIASVVLKNYFGSY